MVSHKFTPHCVGSLTTTRRGCQSSNKVENPFQLSACDYRQLYLLEHRTKDY